MEQQRKVNTKKKKWQQIQYSTRQKIEVLAKAKLSVGKVAEILGYSKRTIERELRRGAVKLRRLKPEPLAAIVPTKREYKERIEYSADIAQQDYDLKGTAKGVQIKLGADYKFCEAVVKHIKNGRSPYSALQLIKQSKESDEKPELQICVKTLYNYIRNDYIPGLTQSDLPERGKAQKRGYNRVRIAINNTKGRSIEERPPEIATRETFGHWEMDCVEGRKTGSKEALLVLSERLTRHELIFKLRNKTQDEVKRILNELEKKTGIRRFRKTFKSVTVDNGSEFLNQAVLEKSIGKGNSTIVTHIRHTSAGQMKT